MSTFEPRDVPRLFLDAMNSGDVDAVVSLYETEGVVAMDGDRSEQQLDSRWPRP